MGLFDQIRGWLAGGSAGTGQTFEQLAALVWSNDWPSTPGRKCGKVIYTSDPRFDKDPIYLTRLVFQLGQISRSDYPSNPIEARTQRLLKESVEPDFVIRLPPELFGSNAVFLHDMVWRNDDHPDWRPWDPNRLLRKVRLDGQGKLLKILPPAKDHVNQNARQRLRLLRAQGGREVAARLVQAHHQLFSADVPAEAPDLPGVAIFSDDPEADPSEMADIASQLYEFRDRDETPPELADGIGLLRANGSTGWHYHRRARARAGDPYYVADLFLPRAFLQRGYLSDRELRCLAQPGDVGGIELLPFLTETGPEVTWDRAWTAWNDGAALRMAQGFADEANYGDLPVLGDALEEAGCDNAQILEHCRAGVPHEGDCWVVEGLLALGVRPVEPNA